MSKPKPTVCISEPAARPVTIDLSEGEIFALVKHHEAQAVKAEKFAIKEIGKLKLQANASTRLLDEIAKQASSTISAHYNRAKGLQAILLQQIETRENSKS